MQSGIEHVVEEEVRVSCGTVELVGDLALPEEFSALVLFAHGSGSGRRSVRNRQVAQELQQVGFATLLFDLLTQAEEKVDLFTRQHRFDIPMLAGRMECATRWVAAQPRLRHAAIGYFGASTGSAAALIAAARLPAQVRAVVSRGGRPDLAGAEVLGRVAAPTLLIVGGEDHAVVPLNEDAYRQLRCEKQLELVPGATHLFEEPGTLERVTQLAAGWFTQHLRP